MAWADGHVRIDQGEQEREIYTHTDRMVSSEVLSIVDNIIRTFGVSLLKSLYQV